MLPLLLHYCVAAAVTKSMLPVIQCTGYLQAGTADGQFTRDAHKTLRYMLQAGINSLQIPLMPYRATGICWPSRSSMMPYASNAAFSFRLLPSVDSSCAASQRAWWMMLGSASSCCMVTALSCEFLPDCLMPDHRSPGPLPVTATVKMHGWVILATQGCKLLGCSCELCDVKERCGLAALFKCVHTTAAEGTMQAVPITAPVCSRLPVLTTC